MKKVSSSRLFLSFLATVLLLNALAPATHAADQPAAEGDRAGSLQVEADRYEVETDTGWATGEGNVKIAYRGMILESDRIRVNLKSKDVEAEGNIYLYTLDEPGVEIAEGHEFFWKGQKIKGNFDTREFQAGASSGKLDEWFALAGTSHFVGTGDVVLKDVHISTCEYVCDQKAHYRLEAKEVVYKSKNGRITAKHAVYKVGNVPIFYWPYVKWDTRDDGGNIRYRIGYSDDWGAFLTVARGIKVGSNAETEFKVDLMSDRGVGVGNETRYITENTFTELHLYGVADQDAPEDADGMNRRFDSEDGRYRTKAYHLSNPAEGLTLRANVDKLSDIDMLEEWYKREFEDYRQPTSYGDIRYETEHYTASLGAKFRVNDFYTVAEKLPELRLDIPRQQLFDSPLYYQSETSLAYLKMNWRDFDQDEWWPAFPVDMTPLYNYPSTYETLRFDTVQMLYLPFQAGGLVQIVPRAGFRLTHYGDTSEREVSDDELATMFYYDNADLDLPINNVSLYDEDGGSATRFAGELGVELSTKMTRLWGDVKSDRWGLDGLRHVVQPYVNYTFVSEPTEDRENLLYFDETDRLRGENFVRLGTEQRFQTRREKEGMKRIYTLARVDTYADFHLDKSDGRKHPGDFATRFRFDPKEQISFWGTVLTDMNSATVRWFEVGTALGNAERLSLNVSYIVRDEDRPPPITTFGSTIADYTGENITSGELSDAHLANLTLNFRIDDLTHGAATYIYDFEEKELARQMYSLNRDLHCWTGSLFVGDDYGDFLVGFALQLKAFPDIAIEADIH